MSAGSKHKDTDQKYSLSNLGPSYHSPSGHELSFYETEDNERLVVRHASGSHIEFKADGSVFIKSIKDLHMQTSVVSDQAGGFDGSVKGADHTTLNHKTDLAIDVDGRLTIKCKELDFEVGNNTYFKSGADFKVEANNVIHKAAGQASIEATKSIYMDTKEKRERFVSTVTEVGSEETVGGLGGGFAPIGGVNVINVTGNTVIENSNPSGGITISSAGYLNLIAGGERIDITGKWGPMSTGKATAFLPSAIAKPFASTFTNLVFDPLKGIPDPKMQYSAPPGTGGSYFTLCEGSKVDHVAMTNFLSPLAAGNGYLTNVMLGNKTENVLAGNNFRNVTLNEIVTIGLIQKTTAAFIFLN